LNGIGFNSDEARGVRGGEHAGIESTRRAKVCARKSA
jgi:hypothetical protein